MTRLLLLLYPARSIEFGLGPVGNSVSFPVSRSYGIEKERETKLSPLPLSPPFFCKYNIPSSVLKTLSIVFISSSAQDWPAPPVTFLFPHCDKGLIFCSLAIPISSLLLIEHHYPSSIPRSLHPVTYFKLCSSPGTPPRTRRWYHSLPPRRNHR